MKAQTDLIPTCIVVPYGWYSWKLPIFEPLKACSVRSLSALVPDMVYCEIRRGEYNLENRLHPFNPDATVHICPYHFAVLFWRPRNVP